MERSGQLRPFLRRTQLLPGESLPSFLIRLMSLNGYHPGVLAELVGARTTNGGRRSAAGRLSDDMERPQRAVTYFRLSELTKLAPVRLYQASVHAFAPTLVPPGERAGSLSLPNAPSSKSEGELISLPLLTWGLFSKHLRGYEASQFCSCCLGEGESTYHRLIWTPLAVSVCLRHKCLLQFTCPSCSQHTRLADVVEGVCGRCDASLSSSPTVSVEHDPVGLAVQALLQSWLLGAGDVGKQPELPSVDRQIAVQPFNDGVLSLLPELPKATVPVLYRLAYGLSKSAMVAMQDEPGWGYLHAGPALRAQDTLHLSSDDMEAKVQLSSESATEGHRRRRGLSRGPAGTSLSLTPSLSYMLFATATKSLCNWPQGFYDFMSAFRTVRNARRGGAAGDGGAPATQNLATRHEGRRTGELEGAKLSGAREGAGSRARHMAEVALAPRFSILKTLGSLYTHWIESDWQHAEFKIVQEAFNTYLRDHYVREAGDTPLRPLSGRRYRHSLETAQTFGYATFAEAAQLLGTDMQAVKRLVRMGRLRGRWFGRSKLRDAMFVEWTELEELHRRRCVPISMEGAARYLGISALHLPDMVYQRLLQAESGPGVDGSAEWVFSEAGLEECVALVYASIPASMRNAPSHLAGEGANITVARAAQVLSQIGLSAAGVLRLLLDSRLEAHTSEDQKTSGGLRSLLFTETSVNAYLDSVLSASTWLGYLEVAARMNIVRKHGIVKEWARRGLLHAVSAQRGVYLFDPVEIERFVASHMLAREVADLLGVGMNTVQSWVRGGRLSPISGPGVDAAEVFLFHRKDIESMMDPNED